MYDTHQEPDPEGIIEAVYNVWIVFQQEDMSPEYARELEGKIAEAVQGLCKVDRVVVEFKQQIRRRKREGARRDVENRD